MSIRALLMSLVGLLVLVCMASFLVWLDSDPVSRQEGGANSFLAPQKAYACIQLATRTPTPSRTPTLAFTPTPTPVPIEANIYVDVNCTNSEKEDKGRSWENAYLNIASAISAASNGHTIYVAEGTYTGYYTVNKNIKILGGFRVNHSTHLAKRDPSYYVTKVRTSVVGQPVMTLAYSGIALDGLWFCPINGQTSCSLSCSGSSNISIRNCRFERSASEVISGGGIYMSATSNIVFMDCAFRRLSYGQYGAGYIVMSGTGNKFERCIFDGNYASGSGGALYCNATSLTFNNCLFVNNSAVNQGSALYLGGSGSYTLNHCTITKNGVSSRSAIAVYQMPNLNSLLINSSIIYNNIFGNLTIPNGSCYYSCIGITQAPPGVGNIFTDPLFYRPDFDWHLRPDSPCLNAADPNSTVSVDLSGNIRTNPFGAYYDMGCYEWPDPKFFGVVEQCLPSIFSFRTKHGFPESIPEPLFLVPEQIDDYINTLDDLGVKSIEVFLPWAMIEVLPGSNTGTDTAPLFLDPVYLWDNNGDYNESEIGTIASTDWDLNLQNPYDLWSEPEPNPTPVWPKYSLEDGLSSRYYHNVSNLGFMKLFLKQWAEYTRNFFDTLHEHGIEIAVAIEMAPAWRVTNDSQWPYADALRILNTNNDNMKKLRWFTSILFDNYIQGTKMNDADAGYPGLQNFVAYFEKQFPYIDLYTPWQEIELNFVYETKNPRTIDYRHKECWEVLKAMKEGLDSSPDNSLYINVFEQYSDAPDYYGVPIARHHIEYINGLIDQAGAVDVGTPTPLPEDKIKKLREVVKIIGINIPHGIGGEDSVVAMSPYNTAQRGLNRLEYTADEEYGTGIYKKKVLDYFEVWDQENSVYRGCNKERGPWAFVPVIDQLDNPEDQKWAADTTYYTAYNYLRNPNITRSRYTYSIDTRMRKIHDWFDSGLFEYQFSTKYNSTEISDIIPSGKWTHPITGIASGQAGVFDYKYGEYKSRYPAYYSLKCLRRNLNNPELPYITSFTVNSISSGAIVYDNTPITITVNLNKSVFGSIKLLIDGLEVSSNSGNFFRNQLTFSNVNLLPEGVGGDNSLAIESKYHRMSLLVGDNFCGNTNYFAGTIGDIETGYRFITISNGTNDYADSGLTPVPIQQWSFTGNPFPAWTPTPTGTFPTDTPIPPTNAYTPTQTPTGTLPIPTAASTEWNRRSFYSTDGRVIPTETFIGYSSTDQGIVFTGGGACGVCNYERPLNNIECCSNMPTWVRQGTPIPTPTIGGIPTPVMVSVNGLYATPMPDGECNYNNHECNPFCTLDNWEGAEMWKQISTVGYKNIIVEFDLKASGLSDLPHGMRPLDQENESNSETQFYTNFHLRPYTLCSDDGDDGQALFRKCPDALLIDEVFMVCYTSDYDSPYTNRGIPVFRDPSNYAVLKGISKWDVAKMIPHRVLKEDYSDYKKVVLDFSGRSEVDNSSKFGLWFRSQLDNQEDKIYVDNIKVYGQRN